MAVDDLWMKRGENGKKVRSARHGRGKRWRVRYTDPSGQPRQRLFAREVDAQTFDVNTRADISRGTYVDTAAGRVTVKAYADEFRATRLHADTTAENVERMFRNHVEPILGNRAIASVRPTMIQAWVKDRADHLSPLSLSTVYSQLAAMFSAAVIDRVIAVSPCRQIRLPDIPHVEHFIPTPQQVHALAEALPAISRGQAYTAAGCGLRQGEVWGLELEHLDFMHRVVRVRQQLKVTKGSKPFIGPLKTKTSRRDVEMGTVVAEKLARHIELHPPAEVEIEDRTDPRNPVTRKAKLVFVNSAGDPWRRPSWAPHMIAAVKAAGLPEGFAMHGLRHYYATALIAGGASPKTVQLALGHSKPTITMNVYAGFWPEDVGKTRGIIDAALGAMPVRLSAVS